MITHLALLKPRPDLTEADYEQAMPDTVDLMAALDFDNLEGLKTYLHHAAHAELGELFGTSLSSALVYDFEVGDLQLLGQII